MIAWTPDPIALQLGPLSLYWYGIAYAVGLAGAYLIITRQAQRFGERTDFIGNSLIIVAVAALVGGRLYHVIDQWQNLYAADPIKVILPPYSGLGIFGGFITGRFFGFAGMPVRRPSFTNARITRSRSVRRRSSSVTAAR